MQHFSLTDLTTRIKRSIAINFPDSVWVEAEIAQANENRGNWYIDLVQKEEGSTNPLAQISAVIWRSTAARISKSLDVEMDSFLDPGQQVLVEADVDYHEIYGLKLNIKNVDKNFTEGILAKQRAATIAELFENGLWDKNRSIPIPRVVQNIAVISNENAAGYSDFIHQVVNNKYGYTFRVELFETALQGVNAKNEIPQQLQKIQNGKTYYDATVIIRGGGSKMDLSVFDDPEVVNAIANHRFPVITGIGHEKDESIADMIAAVRLKTPTATATYLIEKLLSYENDLVQGINKINQAIQYRIVELDRQILKNGERIISSAKQQVSFTAERLNEKWNLIRNLTRWQIERESEKLVHIESLFTELDPKQLLAKGYSILTCNGEWIKESKDLSANAEIVNFLKGGSITSIYKGYEQEDKQ